MATQKSQKQSALLLILICIFAACSDRDDTPLVETDIPKESVEGTAIESPLEKTEQKNPIEMDVSPEPAEPV